MLVKKMIGVDVGGYVGEFIRHLQDTVCDDIFCFEPLNPYFDVCKSFTDHSEVNIEVIKKGLYRDGEYYITPLSDGSSIFAEGETTEKIDCISLHTFTKEKNITHIDYLKLNCEGCEYTILGDLIESNLSFTEIYVQFHDDDFEVGNSQDILEPLSEKYDIYAHRRWDGDDVHWHTICEKNHSPKLYKYGNMLIEPVVS